MDGLNFDREKNRMNDAAVFKILLNVRSGALDSFLEWRSKLDEAMVSASGFLSMEVIPPVSESGGPWVILQKFRSAADLEVWRGSDLHQSLMLEVLPNLSEGPLGLQEGESKDCFINEVATQVFVTKVRPQESEAFRTWEAKMRKAESKFEGYQGVYIQTPANLEQGNWMTILRFNNAKNLEAWLHSDERRAILQEGRALFDKLESHRVESPFGSWFSSVTKKSGGVAPAVWKQTMLVLLVLFPMVLLEIKFLSPWTEPLGITVGTFIGNAISVSLVSWPMMPLVISCLGWWLEPNPASRQQINFLGALLVLFLYVLEIILLGVLLFPKESLF